MGQELELKMGVGLEKMVLELELKKTLELELKTTLEL